MCAVRFVWATHRTGLHAAETKRLSVPASGSTAAAAGCMRTAPGCPASGSCPARIGEHSLRSVSSRQATTCVTRSDHSSARSVETSASSKRARFPIRVLADGKRAQSGEEPQDAQIPAPILAAIHVMIAMDGKVLISVVHCSLCRFAVCARRLNLVFIVIHLPHPMLTFCKSGITIGLVVLQKRCARPSESCATQISRSQADDTQSYA
jgi:hypothetical protein